MRQLRRESHLARYRQIAEVLAHHGLGYLASASGLERFVPHHVPFTHGPEPLPHSRPERVRLALEELGATFIKLGQILSTRADLLPADYQAELARLQDAAPALPDEVMQAALVEALGQPIETAFARFDPTPLASASIGQVYAATRHDGTEVVVKVRRPGVVEQIEEDLEILQNLAATASRHWSVAAEYDAVGLAQEFAQTLRAELDYIREGRNAERFAANFAREPGLHIPRVYWDTTTSRVLTLERIRGTKINDLPALDAAGIDRKALARRAAEIILKMVVEDGFFHADPHPGNFFIEPSGRLGLIDFGMVGTVDVSIQEQLIDLVLAITSQDGNRLVDAFLGLGMAQHQVDRASLRRDLEHLVSPYYGEPLHKIAIGPLFSEAFSIIRRHHLQMPANLALLLKTIVMNEGLGVQLDPGFNLATVLAPYARRLLLREYSPVYWAGRLRTAGIDMVRLGVELPEHLRRLLGELEQGGLEVGVRPAGFEPLIARLERIANRIVLGIIAAAFVNGLAVLTSVYPPPGWQQFAGPIFAVGFAIAALLGAYLAWTILRSGRG